MSELSPLALLNPLNGPRDGSCGQPVPNTTFKVIDVMTGKNLEANKEGEICCKGPQVTYIHIISLFNQIIFFSFHNLSYRTKNKCFNCLLLGNERIFEQ